MTLITTMNSLCISSFLYGCKLSNKVGEVYQHLYDTNNMVRYMASLSNQLYCLLIFQHSEPSRPYWVSKSVLLSNEPFIYKKYSFYEKYSYLSLSPMSWFDEITDKMSFFFQVLMSTIYNSYNNQYMCEGSDLFIMKLFNENKETCYFTYQNDKRIEDVKFMRSQAKFLSIEYKHPEMLKGIELTVERSWFFAGNELFTPTFVLRCLNYQSQAFTFDSAYTITIVDRDINMFEFGRDTHIVLSESGYNKITHIIPYMIEPVVMVEKEEEEDEEDEDNEEEEEDDEDENPIWILPGNCNR